MGMGSIVGAYRLRHRHHRRPVRSFFLRAFPSRSPGGEFEEPIEVALQPETQVEADWTSILGLRRRCTIDIVAARQGQLQIFLLRFA
jgi:hypothetical protein